MFDDRETTEARIRRFIQHDLIPHIHQQTAPVRLRALRLPGEPIPPRERSPSCATRGSRSSSAPRWEEPGRPSGCT